MTIREIAELAGVSIGTVDRVLYKRGRVSPETRAKIDDIIEQYQFSPNPHARNLKRNRPYRFCVLLPRRDQDSGYWTQIIEGINNGAHVTTPLGVVTEIVEYDRYDLASFRNASISVLEKKPDGLIFVPIMPDTTLAFVTEIQAEGIPYLFIDTNIPAMHPVCAIGQDPRRSGYVAGKMMHLFINTGRKPLAVIDAYGEDYHIKQRRIGFVQYAGEHDLPVIVQEYSGFQGTDLLLDDIESFLRKNRDLGGIFVTNAMVHRVADAVQKGNNKDIAIIGYDLLPEARRFLEDGRITALISQRPYEQGRLAIINLYRSVVLEQVIAPKIDIPINIYIKENIPPELEGGRQ
jgi:LacI family transcriptional regulator